MRCAVAIGVILLLSGVGAFAQTSPPGPHPARAPDPSSACDGQYDKFCGTVVPGAGRKLLCMMNHLPQLMPACRARTQMWYKLESDQAVARHMTVSEFMEWGQTLHEQAKKAHKSYKIGTPAPAPAAGSNTQPRPSNTQQN